MSPWRVLFSIDACSGLMPPVPRISPRLRSSASLYICTSIELVSPGPLSAGRTLHHSKLSGECVAHEEEHGEDVEQRMHDARATACRLEQHVRDEAERDAFGNADGERHHHDRQERRDRFGWIRPVDMPQSTD